MARVPITVMGFRCDRCGHEWVPRGGTDEEPRVCPSCHSYLWNQPEKKPRMSYEHFRSNIAAVLKAAGKSLTWTEVRTLASLPQAFPNNQWVHKMEKDIGLRRWRERDGTIHWELKETLFDAPSQTANENATRSRRKQGTLE